MLYTNFRLTPAIRESLNELSAIHQELDAHRYGPGEMAPELRRHLMERQVMAARVHFSTKIEGNPLSLPQVETLLNGEPVSSPENDRQEILNYYDAMQYVRSLGSASSPRLNEDTIKEIHCRITQSLRDDDTPYNPGRYREGQNFVRTFRPPPAERVEALMDEYVRWLNTSQGLYPYCKAALAHINFIAIHPFWNGNGRTARVIETLVLYLAGYKSPALVSLEEYFGMDDQSYHKAIEEAVGNVYDPAAHDVTSWVEYYLHAYLAQAGEALARHRRLKAGTHALADEYMPLLTSDLRWRRHSGLFLFDWNTASPAFIIRATALVIACNSGPVTNKGLRWALSESTGTVSRRTLVRHLSWLANHGLLIRYDAGSSTCYFPSETVARIFETAGEQALPSPSALVIATPALLR